MLLPMVAGAESVEIDGIYYNLIPKGKVAEVTINSNKYSGSVDIPASITYNGTVYNVEGIGSSAFDNCSDLTSVTIPNSVTRIGVGAFSHCTGLISVHISDIDAWCKIAFSDSSSNPLSYAHHLYLGEEEITDLVIPNSVTSIGNYAFRACSGLTSVTIPNSVTSIGGYAFSWCSGLTSVTIGNSVTSIGNSAFENCSSLTSVTIGNSVTSIGENAFLDCTGLTSVHISDIAAWCKISFSGYKSNPLSYAHHLYLGEEEIKNLVIPSSVTSIGRNTFRNCSGLVTVTIGNGVTSIGGGAFYGCTNLAAITIPNSVTRIEDGFQEEEIIRFKTGEIIDYYQIGAFKNCTSLTSVTIPNSVTSIGEYAFMGCSGLISVTIPNSVTSLKRGTFCGCSSLTTVTIPNSVTSIEDGYIFNGGFEYYGVFSGCRSLTSVTIPNSVTSIGDHAFSGCRDLTSVSIGCCVKSIGSKAFAFCEKLTDVYCWAEEVPWMYLKNPAGAFDCTDAFQDSYIEYATLHVPITSINTYKAVEPWKNFKTIVEGRRCTTPTIAFVDGKLKFSCETEGVEYVSELTSKETNIYYGDEVAVGGTYTVSVYATKEDYFNSDVATLEFTIGANGEVCDVNKDGAVDVADIATIIDKMAGN